MKKEIKAKNNKPFITMNKSNYFLMLVMGFIIMILGGIYMNSSLAIGSLLLGFGFAICILLLEQKMNSIKKQ